MIFGDTWEKPSSGSTSGRVQGFAAHPHEIQRARGQLVTIPGPIVAQVHWTCRLRLLDTPSSACRRHGAPQGSGAHEAPPLAPLRLAQTGKGLAGTESTCHCPAVARVRQEVVYAAGEGGGDKRFDQRRRFSLASPCGRVASLPTPHDDAEGPPRQAPGPQRPPGLPLGPGF